MRALTATMKVGIPGPEGSIAKLQWSSTNQALTELAVEVGGIEALTSGNLWAYRFLRSRANSIEGGTSRRAEEHRRRARARPAEARSVSAMDFDFNDEQREIKSTAHDFLASRFKPEKVRELAESESPYDDALWKEICELGWPGIAISEEHGGQGLGVVELVILQEELGYVLRAGRR